jgi:hypothetical protein
MVGAGYLVGRGIVTQALSDEELYESLMRRVGTAEEYLGTGNFFDPGGINPFRRRLMEVRSPSGGMLFGPGTASRGLNTFLSTGGNLPGMAQASMAAGFGMGIGPDAGAEFFGSMARVGQGRTEGDVRRFAVLIGETIATTGMRGREAEILGAISQYMQMTMRTATAPPGLQSILDFQTRLVQGGTTDAERAGMRGSGGLRVLGAVHEAITGTQLFGDIGGGLMRPFLMATLGRSGMGNPADMQNLIDQGPFASMPNGQSVLQGLMETMGPMIQAGGPGEIAGAQMFRLSMPLFRRLVAAMSQPGMFGLADSLGLNQVPETRLGTATGVMEQLAEGLRTRPQDYDQLVGDAREQIQNLIKQGPTAHEKFAEARANVEWKLVELGTQLSSVFQRLVIGASSLADIFAGVLKELGVNIPGLIRREPQAMPQAPSGLPDMGQEIPDYQFYGAPGSPLGAAPEVGPETSTAVASYPIPGSRMERLYGMAAGLGLPRGLAARIAMIESSGGRNIKIGRSNERGPLQMQPWLFRHYDPGITEAEMDSPRGDIAALQHMDFLWRKYRDPAKVAAAWNSGEDNVDAAVQSRGAMWFTAPGIPQKYLRDFAATESIGVPGGVGSAMGWWETMARDGITIVAQPATVIIRNERGEEIGRTQVQYEAAPAGSYHGSTESPVAP